MTNLERIRPTVKRLELGFGSKILEKRFGEKEWRDVTNLERAQEMLSDIFPCYDYEDEDDAGKEVARILVAALDEAEARGAARERAAIITEIRRWARQTIIAPVEVFRDREKLLARLDELEKS